MGSSRRANTSKDTDVGAWHTDRGKKNVVVMPAYNAGETLLRTYEEVVAQDYVDLVVVVDDARAGLLIIVQALLKVPHVANYRGPVAVGTSVALGLKTVDDRLMTFRIVEYHADFAWLIVRQLGL